MTTENEARDYHGRWTAGAGGVPGETRNVAFHGTTKSFEKFSPGDPTEFMLDRALGPHFAADPEIANSFTMERVNGRDIGAKEGGRIIPVVLPSDERFITANQPRYDWAKDKDIPPEKEWSVRSTDQNVIEQMIAKAGFQKDPTLLEHYLEQARAIPADQAPQLARDLAAGKTVSVGGDKPADMDRFLANYGGRPYNEADRARMVDLAKQSFIAQGYAGIKYINTSPMENATATNPTSYIVFNPNDVKPLYGEEHHPETQRYLDEYDKGEPTDYHPSETPTDTPESAIAHAKQIAGSYKPLEGLPQPVIKLKDGYYQPGPMARLKDAAADYMAKASLSYTPIQKYQAADPDFGTKIAQAFDQMKHDPENPAVKASYAALAKETMAQWQAIKSTGLKVDWIKPGQPDPYADTPRSAERDVSENNHWWGFPTDQGFGSDPNLKGNPMLADSGEVIGGRHALVNDVFRIVHDMFGHIKDGNGFTPSGEDNAWRSHYAMFSPAARPAMTTETRGQSEWVNFGPHGADNRAKLYGTGAVSSNTGGGVIYAPQKIGLLPQWAQDGAKDRP